jgi:glycosyltransferase involved in cell wall biosynthesis
MKTIALLHYAYPPKIGGVERLMSQHAQVLSKLGHGVHIVTGSGQESNPNIKLTVVPELQALKHTVPDLHTRLMEGNPMDAQGKALSETIQASLETHLEDADVIIVHNMLTLIHNLPFIAAFKAYVAKHPEKKILVWTHDQTFVDNGQIVMEKEGVKLHPEVKSLLLTPVSGALYVAISETFKSLLTEVMRIDPNHMCVIPNGINVQQFLEIDDRVWEFFQKERLHDAFPLLLSPVNVLPRKNLEFALDVVAHLREAFPQIRYLISGTVSQHRDTSAYQTVIQEKVKALGLESHVVFVGEHITGSMSDAQLHDLYTLADGVLYFSKQENFGLPILEAGLTKTPLWVSDLSVFHEVGGDNLAYVSNSATVSEVADRIQGYFHATKGSVFKQHVQKHYDLDMIVRTMLVPRLE